MDSETGQIKRRDFLQLAGRTLLTGALASTGVARARDFDSGPPEAGDLDKYDFVIPRVRVRELAYRGGGKGPDFWNVRPGGDANLLRELTKVIRCRVKPILGTFDWQPQYAVEGQFNAVVDFDEPKRLREYPFLFMTGENHYEFTESQKRNLKEYITRGGFLLIDDCVVASGGDFFYQSSYRLLEGVFGSGSVRSVPREHEVFHNVYDLGGTGLPLLHYTQDGRPHGLNHGARGLFIRDRLAVFLSSTDLHCGWCDSHGTTWGLHGYRRAVQMGINIIMYALTH